jgi:hypothetical protein
MPRRVRNPLQGDQLSLFERESVSTQVEPLAAVLPFPVAVEAEPDPLPINEPEPPPVPSGELVRVPSLQKTLVDGSGKRPEYRHDLDPSQPLAPVGVLLGKANGMARVSLGVGNVLEVPEDKLTPYAGAVSVYRQVVVAPEEDCDRPDCDSSSTDMFCARCRRRPKSVWRYTGVMAISIDALPPLKWPDAVYFPAGFDPNGEGGKDAP